MGSDVFSEDEIRPYKASLEAINGHLENAGRALGHRVWQAIEQYMANHPDVRSAHALSEESEERRDELERALRIAFEDAVVQKVMPKLRGIETSGEARQRALDPIRGILDERGLDLVEDFDIACRGSYGTFVWKSARYLQQHEQPA